MDEDKIRETLTGNDNKSLDDRIFRWKQIAPVTYSGTLMPDLLWEYINETDEMYIQGSYIGVIVLCSTTIELVLADQLKSINLASSEKIERFNLEQMVKHSEKQNILTTQEMNFIEELRLIRNALTHANVGKLNEMARKRYGDQLPNKPIIVSFYLASIGDGGIDKDALKFLKFTRDLTIKFYGVRE